MFSNKKKFDDIKKINPELYEAMIKIREKQKEYLKEYRQRPEAKSKKKEYMKNHHKKGKK